MSEAKTEASGRPLLIVVAAPSGAGKTTLCDRLLGACERLTYSVSCTTRSPRGCEEDGEDYFFLSEEAFMHRREANAFLEYAEVHGHYYGTLRETVEGALAEGNSVLMDLDVQGAAQLRDLVRSGRAGETLNAAYIDIFIEPPSLEALRERLAGRAEDSEEVIERRLINAQTEMARADEFQYRVVNADLDRAYADLCAILLHESRGSLVG